MSQGRELTSLNEVKVTALNDEMATLLERIRLEEEGMREDAEKAKNELKAEAAREHQEVALATQSAQQASNATIAATRQSYEEQTSGSTLSG